MSINTFKHSQLYILFTLVLILGSASYAVPRLQCQTLFSSDLTLWRPSGGSLFMDIRDNCAHYWAWAKSLKKNKIPKPLLEEGIVVGDPHILNFADAFINGQRKLRLVDLDDSGHGPFLFDFVKFMTSVKAQRLSMSTDELFEKYLAGLREEKQKKPQFLEDALNKSRKDEKEHDEEHFEKMIDGDKFRMDSESDFMRISDAPFEVQKLYKKDKHKLKKALKDFKILDHAVRIKPTGGSAYHPRFWFLVENDKGKKLTIEFKLDTTPGIAQFEPQTDFVDRIKEVMDVFWKGERDPYFRAVEVGDHSYFMRLKYKPFVEFLEIDDSEDKYQAKKFLLHIAYHMGRMVASQKSSSDYVSKIEDRPEYAVQLIDQLAEQYLDIAKKLHRLQY